MRTYVTDFKDGTDLDVTLQVRRVSVQDYRQREGSFLRLRLGDRMGEIESRVWDFNRNRDPVPLEGELVKVQGRVVTFRENLELHIARYEPVPWEGEDPTDYLPVTPFDRDVLLAEIKEAASHVEDRHLSALLDSFFADEAWVAAFIMAPAAKVNHQAYIGGLLEHTANLVRMIPALLANYPAANRELLLVGAMLHDVGKIEEYTWDRFIDISDRGRLLGHIILGAEAVSRRIDAIPGFPAQLRDKLLHIIASHHGHYEWQSPKRPKFLEACLVHHIDLLDGEAQKFLPTAGSPDEGWEWVERLERWVYRS